MWFRERKPYIAPALVAMFITLVIYAVMTAAYPSIEGNHILPGYSEILSQVDTGSWIWNLLYSFMDYTQAGFIATTVGGILGLLFLLMAYYLGRIGSPLAFGGVSGRSTHTLQYLVFSQFIAVFAANLFWRYVIEWPGWFPTFTPMVSVLPAAILFFGRPDWKKALTGIVCSVITVPFMCQLLIDYIQKPYGLNAYAAALGIMMPAMTAMFTEIFKLLPWMTAEDNILDLETCVPEDTEAVTAMKRTPGYMILLKAFGGDLSDMLFWNCPLAGFGIMIGAIMAYFLNPAESGCGANLPYWILMFVSVTIMGLLLWAPYYKEDGYIYTFSGVMIAAGMSAPYANNLPIAIILWMMAALIGTPLTRWALNQKFCQRYLPMVTVQFLSAIVALLIGALLKFVGI